MHKLIISVILLCSLCTPVHSWEVFGFSPKTKLSDLTVTKTNLDNLNEVKEYTVNAPKPNKLFEKYLIAYSIKYGVCWIKASGYHPDETYDEITEVIRFNLEKKYGKPNKKSEGSLTWDGRYKTPSVQFKQKGLTWINLIWSKGIMTKTFGTHRITYQIDDGTCTRQSALENRIRKNNAALKEKLKLDAQNKSLSKKLGVSEDNF